MMRRRQPWFLAVLMLAACGETDDEPDTTAAATESAATSSGGGDGADGMAASSDGAMPATSGSSGAPDPSDGSTTGEAGESGPADGGSSSTGVPIDTEGPEMQFHPEFVWFADFVREKCVACHNEGQNGNLLLPSVDMTNDEVRLAIDGGIATTGRLFIEPFDPPESQVYIMITNEAGEQFPAETIDRVAEWINLGAPYYEE
ncbi:MAG: hypothetical protein AAF721_08945 [Myxococcota bacterium]